jgi:hypothetical protein
MSVKHTAWKNMVQDDNGCLHFLPLPGEIYDASFISMQVRCLELPLHSYPSFILMIVFFTYWQQEIADASNDAARKYYEETAEVDRTVSGVTAMMRAAAKAKQQSFKGQFSKFTAVANPKFGDEFLEEVSVFCLHYVLFFLLYTVGT